MLQGSGWWQENNSVPLTGGILTDFLSAQLFRSPAEVCFQARKEV
jgi:hypothetical protein